MKFCKKCGAQAEDNVKFCTECGQAFDNANDLVSENEYTTKSLLTENAIQKSTRKRKNIIIISISLVVVLIAAIVIVFFVPRQTNVKLSNLKDMNEFQIRLMFGKPDMDTDNYLYYEDGRVTFYGIKIDRLSYNKDSHEFILYTYDSINSRKLSSEIYSRCDFISIGYISGFSRYRYKNINISVWENQGTYDENQQKILGESSYHSCSVFIDFN